MVGLVGCLGPESAIQDRKAVSQGHNLKELCGIFSGELLLLTVCERKRKNNSKDKKILMITTSSVKAIVKGFIVMPGKQELKLPMTI